MAGGSDVRSRVDRAGLDSGGERAEVALVLIRVGGRELGERAVERVARAEVRGDRDPVARAGVRARQRPAAELTVGGGDRRAHALDVRRDLPVPELAAVEVALPAVETFVDPHPAEHDVARGLHQALALHDALTLVLVAARAGERLEHRGLRLLELEEQRILIVTAQEQDDPRPRANAAHTDDLAGEVPVPERLRQAP